MEPLDGIFTLCGPAGGAGRSTLTLTMGAALAQAGSEVLLVDLDPRGSLTALSGLADHQIEYGILDALAPSASPQSFVLATPYEGLSVLTARTRTVSELVQLEAALADRKALPRLLNPLREWYHTILIDVPAGVDRAMRAALSASDEILVVVTPDPLAIRTLPEILKIIHEARQLRSVPPELAGIVLNRVNTNLPFFRTVVESLHTRFRPLVLSTAIPEDAWFLESAGRAMPLPMLMPEAPGVLAMQRVMEELRERILPAQV